MSANNSRKLNMTFLLCAFVVFLMQMYKARLGVGSSDEHFYVTLGYRFYQGDAMFYEDWHIAQMIGFFLTPLVYLYRLIMHGNDGIVLGFRIFYSLFTLLVGTVMFQRFKKEYGRMAIVASCCYMLFTPFQIMALSYNTMSVGFLLLGLCFFDSESMVKQIVSGLCYAFAVVNTPYLALLFVGYLVVVFCKKMDVKKFYSFFLGCLIALCMFMAFVLRRSDLGSMLSCMQYLIDPSHKASIVQSIIRNGGKLLLAWNYFLGFVVLDLFYFVKVKQGKIEVERYLNGSYILSILGMLFITVVKPYAIEIGGYVCVLLPIVVVGFKYMLLNEVDETLKLFYWVGVFHAFVIAISSNVGPRSFVPPLITSVVATLLLLQKQQSVYWRGSVGVFVVLCIFFKLTNVYGEVKPFDTPINDGPLMGLYTNQETANEIKSMLEDCNKINQMDLAYVQFVTDQSWPYLAVNQKCAASSTYMHFWYKNEYIHTQDTYRMIHDDRFPALVYVGKNLYEMDANDSWVKQFEFVKEMREGLLFIRH